MTGKIILKPDLYQANLKGLTCDPNSTVCAVDHSARAAAATLATAASVALSASAEGVQASANAAISKCSADRGGSLPSSRFSCRQRVKR